MKQKMKILRYIYILCSILIYTITDAQTIRLNNIERSRDTSGVYPHAYGRTDSSGIQRYHLDYWEVDNDSLYWYIINRHTGDTIKYQSVKVEASGGGGGGGPLSLVVSTFDGTISASSTPTALNFDIDVINTGTDIEHSTSSNNDRFIIKRSGVYLMHTRLKWSGASGSNMGIDVEINDTTVIAQSVIGSRALPEPPVNYVNVGFYAQLDSGDYVRMLAYVGANSNNWEGDGATTFSIQTVEGIQGPAGPAGSPGAPGLSVDTAYVTGDSLYIVLNNQDTINAGFVRGPQGDQGIQGDPGVDIIDLYIDNDSLYVVLSSLDTINAGYLREGLDGISVDTAFIANDSLYIVLSNQDTINAGFLAAGVGTVTSVGLSMPGQFTVTGSPVTGAGTLTAAWNTQSANTFLGGPGSGGPAVPTFRLLGENDIPPHDYTKITGITPVRLLGRYSSPTGVAEQIQIGTGLNLNTSTGVLSSTVTGTVTSVAIGSTDLSVSGSPITSAGTITLNINNDAVTNAKLANNAVSTGKIQANAVTLDKLVTINTNMLLGRYSAGVGNVQQITLGPGFSFIGDQLNFSGGSNWTLSGSTLYPNATTTNTVIGATAMAASGIKFQTSGESFFTQEMYVGGLATASNSFRGWLNVRIREGFSDNGGLSMHSSSGNTHSVTGALNSQIFCRLDGNNFGTTLRTVGTGNFPLTLEGISNETGTSFVSAVTISGWRRSGSNAVAVADNSRTFLVRNAGTNRLEVYGNGYTIVNSTSALKVPVGTTAQRPATPAQGDIRYNTSTSKFEGYDGTNWVNFH